MQPAFTGKLTVRYVHPTPLHRPLACTGRLVERRGRKIWIEGELVDVESGAELARGRTLFIAVEAPARDDPGERPHRPAPPDEDGDAVTPARR